MKRLNINAKIWLSIGVFVLGFVVATMLDYVHGLAAENPLDRPILIGHGRNPGSTVPMTDVRDLILGAMGLD